MLFKKALCEVSYLNVSSNNKSVGLIKTASGKVFIEPGSDKAKIIEAEIKKHPTALFFRAKAIKADEMNSNGDYFTEEEILRSYKTFEGVPFFTNHDNQNVENARGKIIFAEWIPEEKAVYTIAYVDREAFPHICRSIEEEYVTGVSMGFLGMDTEILMGNLSAKSICEVNIGDKVLTPFGNICAVEKIYSNIVGKPMYELDMCTYHKSPLLSDDHPLYIIPSEQIQREQKSSIKKAANNKYLRSKGKIGAEDFVGQNGWRTFDYQPEFRETKDCKNGDYVLIPSKYKIVDNSVDGKDFSYLTGAYVGDGYIVNDKQKEPYNLAYYIGLHEKKELGEKLVQLLPKFTKSNILRTEFPVKNGLKISVNDKLLSSKMLEKFGKLAHHKRIYQKEWSKEEVISFISGYIDTDGTIAKNYNKKNNGEIRGGGIRGVLISSCNQSLLEDVQSLLIAIDIPSYISWVNRLPNKNSLVKVPTLDFSLFISYGNIHVFSESIKVRNAIKDKTDREIDGGKTFIFTSKNGQKYMACAIKEIIEKQYDGPCYDLKVAKDECYIADGIGVHNCSVEYSICSICGNKAEKTDSYCTHIRNKKGRTFSGTAKDIVTGETKEFKNAPVFEYNYGIKFIELSAVVDPACPSCKIQGVISNDDYMKRVANIQNSIYMIKSAAIEKEAGQEEITQLNQVLQTLEGIAINLIKNRQQVEVEFASDLVGILSELQTFVDELIGAGYGKFQGQGQGIPGVMPDQSAAAAIPQTLPTAAEIPMTPLATPAASETALSTEPVGNISGSPLKPLVKGPKLPITAPAKPKANAEDKMLKVASLVIQLQKLEEKINNMGDSSMAKRRTISEKVEQKKVATENLSNSWQEKQDLFEYIKKVPSIQDNNHKLSVKKRDDTFIIIAENKSGIPAERIWSYDNLTDREKTLIRETPDKAALYFLKTFANNTIKGDSKMSNIKEAGAGSVNKAPEVITEAQLEAKNLYHERTGENAEVVTQSQLEGKRSGEKEVVTESQLTAKRENQPREVITEKQLEVKENASPRTNKSVEVITQSQLDANKNRISTDPDVITERQLDQVDAPWKRAAARDPKMFKSAGEHMNGVLNTLADVVIATGCTPQEAAMVGGSLVNSTKGRFELASAILDKPNSEKVDGSKRLAYWSSKNIKVATVGSTVIASSIVDNLKVLAADSTINPDSLLDALDVIAEGKEGAEAINRKVDEKIELAKTETVVASNKSELRNALKSSIASEDQASKESRNVERKEIVEAVKKEEKEVRKAERKNWLKASKQPDTKIVTDFQELGVAKDSPEFRSAIKSFTKGALASRNIKLAAITNVTISGDTITIAVQTDEGDQSVEIPITDKAGTEPKAEEIVPEADLAGEGLGNAMPPAAPPPAGMPPPMASSKKMVKEAQVGGGIPQTPGAVAAPGAPEGGITGAPPMGDPASALTTDPAMDKEISDEIPTAGQQQPLGAICPECGTSDTDVTVEDDGNLVGQCKNPACGAKWEALVKKEVEYKLLTPSKAGQEPGAETPEPPAEVPALPVAAQTRIDKNSIVRIGKNLQQHGHVCPACGMNQCKASVKDSGDLSYVCPACNTETRKDIIVNVNKPSESYLRVQWDMVPNEKCSGCKEASRKLAAKIRVGKMMKSAAATEFPTANCKEYVSRKWGGSATASYGPCKGELLADCICSQLKKLGLRTTRYIERLASVYTQQDPMIECLEDQKKKGLDVKEATNVCNCLKKKFASEADDNPFLQAFAEDIQSGKEKILTAQDLGAINDEFGPVDDEVEETEIVEDADVDIADAIPPEPSKETVTIEVSKETAEELAQATTQATEETEIEVDVDVSDKSDKSEKGDKEMATAMQTHKLRRVGEEVVKIAATPTKVESIEGNVEAKVPRSEQKLGEESKADSLMNKPNKGPDVPRSTAYMGKEKEADSLINKELKLPDVAVDSSYMGKEKEVQKGMPAINNEIKGTVIAGTEKVTKEAKQMKEIETVEKDVEAKVPRSEQKLGEEAKADSLINEPNKGPDVPRSSAYMGKEKDADSLINKELKGPDVPIDSAFMGHEKEVQKGMSGINDEMLKNVQQKRDIQLERIANARKQEAMKVAYKLLATKRISEEAFDDVVDSLSHFEIDKISTKAEVMYPRQVKTASVETGVHSGAAIVMESKEIKAEDPQITMVQKLAKTFTIGNASFDEKLTRYGEK